MHAFSFDSSNVFREQYLCVAVYRRLSPNCFFFVLNQWHKKHSFMHIFRFIGMLILIRTWQALFSFCPFF